MRKLCERLLVPAIFLATIVTDVAFADEPEPVRGVVKSLQEAVMSVDLAARVMEAPLRAGEAFQQGDLLIKFDCQVQKAEANAAIATYAASQAAHNSNVELEKHGAVGQFEVGMSKAEMQRAHAVAQAAKARTRDCVISAPFDGRIADLMINAHETPGPNQPLLKIVSSEEYEIKLIVPSSWLSWLRKGSVFSFDVDETGEKHSAHVWQIGAEVDAVSRTIAVVARFESNAVPVLPGMSGTAYFPGS